MINFCYPLTFTWHLKLVSDKKINLPLHGLVDWADVFGVKSKPRSRDFIVFYIWLFMHDNAFKLTFSKPVARDSKPGKWHILSQNKK